MRLNKGYLLAALGFVGVWVAAPASAEEGWLNKAVFEREAKVDRARVLQYSGAEVLAALHEDTATNVSIIHQQGDANYASVLQSYSTAYQLGNLAFIHQKGSLNRAEITQLGGDNVGLIAQVGQGHEATIIQHGNQVKAIAQIHQFGTASDVNISQSGSGYRSVEVEQHAYSGSALPVTVDTY